MPAYGEVVIGGKKYFTIARASQAIGPSIADRTLLFWCRRKITPWKMDLETISVPIVVHAKAYQPTKRQEQRILIAEDCTYRLKRVLSELHRPIRPSKFTRDELAVLRAATSQLKPA
jgi:hypothetical protein